MSNTNTPERQAAIEAAIDVENGLSVLRHRRLKISTAGRLARYKSFPRQRVGALTKILQHRHGGACETDDGEIYFDLVAPFLVRAAEIEKSNPVAYVIGWARRYVPAFAGQLGTSGIEARVNAMVRLRDEARRTRTPWTPDMPTIVQSLQLTLEESRAIGLRGFGSINPPTAEYVKLRKRDHARKVRLKQGMIPQSERTRTKCDDAVAVVIGRTRRTIQSWRKAKILDAKLAPYVEAGIVDFAKLCPPSREGEHGRHTFAKPVSAGNDNAPLERSA